MATAPYVIRSQRVLVYIMAALALLSAAKVVDMFVFHSRENPDWFWVAILPLYVFLFVDALVTRTTFTENGIEWRNITGKKFVPYGEVRRVDVRTRWKALVACVFTTDGRQHRITGLPNEVTRAEEILRERVSQ